MGMPRLPTRRWAATAAILATATVLATAVILSTGVNQTHATEPVNRQVTENSPGGTAVGTPMKATTNAGTVSYSLTGADAANFAITPDQTPFTDSTVQSGSTYIYRILSGKPDRPNAYPNRAVVIIP